MAINVVIVNTQNALAVWIFAPSAFMGRHNLLGKHEKIPRFAKDEKKP